MVSALIVHDALARLIGGLFKSPIRCVLFAFGTGKLDVVCAILGSGKLPEVNRARTKC